MQGLIVFVSQVLFWIARTKVTQQVVKNDAIKAAISTMVLQGLGMIGLTIGIKGILEGDYFLIVWYILGGGLGSYITVKHTKI